MFVSTQSAHDAINILLAFTDWVKQKFTHPPVRCEMRIEKQQVRKRKLTTVYYSDSPYDLTQVASSPGVQVTLL